MTRIILHLDLDAFFCAVEEQHNPALRGKAFAVGGRPDERGVVASCSYPARRCGVHSAMPMSQAARLCPGLVIVPARHGVYGQVSEQVMDILRNLTPLVEQVSIDEAFLDVSDLAESGEVLARRLQAQIRSELGLPCSLGVATNKLVAKIANDVGKKNAVSAAGKSGPAGPPNAITTVPAGQEAAFLAPLPVEALWGVGPKTAAHLTGLGLRTIGQLAGWPEQDLISRFGKNGSDLASRARGQDSAPVITSHEAKSISQETTFARDIREQAALEAILRELAEGVGRQLRKSDLSGQTVRLKLRWPDFSTLTRQVTLDQPTDVDTEIFQAALALFEKVWRPGQAVRLLGVGVSSLGPPVRQLGLWDQAGEKDRKLQSAVDELRERYGERALVRGAKLRGAKLRGAKVRGPKLGSANLSNPKPGRDERRQEKGDLDPKDPQ